MPVARAHAEVGKVWQKLAALYKLVLSETCETHKLGTANVSPPLQRAWLEKHAAEMAGWTEHGLPPPR